ncbi:MULTISPECIES: hypothetical protein [Streptosporangium]|uniref:Uncharacterized protein n=1 Tax=Streptosporangium brasiliense TaxID=47480 RepID=A0ABT9RIU0_9ACTN|nr:hypothetical protein [Streptosporangium brasiliense]MDP9868624.1 hypothetical protein [Streptosporangium brasiliense]
MRDYGFSPAQQDEIWRRWRDGESFSLMGWALGAPIAHPKRSFSRSSTAGVRLAFRRPLMNGGGGVALIGLVRVSTDKQNPRRQHDALDSMVISTLKMRSLATC